MHPPPLFTYTTNYSLGETKTYIQKLWRKERMGEGNEGGEEERDKKRVARGGERNAAKEETLREGKGREKEEKEQDRTR